MQICVRIFYNFISAGMAELADALYLGSSVYDVQVQLLSSAVLLRIDKHNKI